MNSSRKVLAALAAIPLVLGLAACSPSGPAYVDEGAVYTSETIPQVLESANAIDVAGRSTSEASDLRTEALTALRRRGGDAAGAADVLTRTFANLSPGVPTYVERASFEGSAALVVVEAIGPKAGQLEDERIWVISDSGDILYSATR